MKFSFEESELINNFFENIQELPSKSTVINELEEAKSNTEDTELIDIVNNVINKISNLGNEAFQNLFSDLPVDIYTIY